MKARYHGSRFLKEQLILIFPGISRWTALLFGSGRTLHGRCAYPGDRRLAGAYLNREDVDNKLHVLKARAGA